MRLLLSAFFFTLMFHAAQAHTITWPDGQKFTFGTECCGSADCGALPLDAIKEVQGGYQVDFWRALGADKKLYHFKGFVPFNSPDVKLNPFTDRIMGCHSWVVGNEPGTYKPRCIWPIRPSV